MCISKHRPETVGKEFKVRYDYLISLRYHASYLIAFNFKKIFPSRCFFVNHLYANFETSSVTF